VEPACPLGRRATSAPGRPLPLLANAPGTLTYAWLTVGPSIQLTFFGLSNAPGGSVTIVPEPATALLLALGLLGIALGAPRRS
jgi:hypothetical protein